MRCCCWWWKSRSVDPNSLGGLRRWVLQSEHTTRILIFLFYAYFRHAKARSPLANTRYKPALATSTRCLPWTKQERRARHTRNSAQQQRGHTRWRSVCQGCGNGQEPRQEGRCVCPRGGRNLTGITFSCSKSTRRSVPAPSTSCRSSPKSSRIPCMSALFCKRTGSPDGVSFSRAAAAGWVAQTV